MKELPKELIEEIAEDLELGMKCFIHRHTHELISIPDVSRFEDYDEELFEEDLQRVQQEGSNYIELEGMNSKRSFEIMKHFILQVSDNGLKATLTTILKHPKPFAHFKNEIEQSRYREQWFEFRNNQMMQWVMAQLAGEEASN